MVDDLTSRGVSEPYRMFTSRAEFRLKLRADNADQRLTGLGIAIGCVGSARAAAFTAKSQALREAYTLLNQLEISPTDAGKAGLAINRDGRRRTAYELLALPDVDVARLAPIWPVLASIPAKVAIQLEVDARYACYVDRQAQDVEALRRDEAAAIPLDFDYEALPSLSAEMRQKLVRQRPSTLAQAGRMEGMTPAALLLILSHLKARSKRRSA